MKENPTEKTIGLVSRQIVPYTVPALIKHFDFFNRMVDFEGETLDELSQKFSFDPRVFCAVLNYLTKEGFLERNNENYSLSKEARNILTRRGQYDLTPYVLLYEGYLPGKINSAIAQALTTGKPANWNDTESWAEAMKSGAIAKQFSEGMMARGEMLARALSSSLERILSKNKNLLDIGGSLGDYCGRFVEDYPNLSCSVFELPAVAKFARKNIKLKGYPRIQVVEGDMFNSKLPEGYDIHLFSNVIHDWTPEQSAKLINNSYKSLDKDGKIVVHGLHLNDDRLSPEVAVDHSLCLAVITEGRCYTYGEIRSILEKTGFREVDYVKTVGGYGAVIGTK